MSYLLTLLIINFSTLAVANTFDDLVDQVTPPFPDPLDPVSFTVCSNCSSVSNITCQGVPILTKFIRCSSNNITMPMSNSSFVDTTYSGRKICSYSCTDLTCNAHCRSRNHSFVPHSDRRPYLCNRINCLCSVQVRTVGWTSPKCSQSSNLTICEIGVVAGNRTLQVKRSIGFAATPRFHISYLEGVVTLISDPPALVMARVELNGFSHVFSANGTGSYSIPPQLLAPGGTLFVEMYDSTTLVATTRVRLGAVSGCVLSGRCLLCVEAYLEFACQPLGIQIILICMVIIPIGLAVLFLTPFYWIMSKIVWIMYYTFSGIFYGMRNVNRIPIVKSASDLAGAAANKVAGAFVIPPADAVLPVVRRTVATTLTVLCLISGVAASCDDLVVSSLPLEVCTNSGSSFTCSFQTNLGFVSRGVGRTACASMRTNDSSVSLDFELTWNAQFAVATPTQQYYTADWAGWTDGVLVCPGPFSDNLCNNDPADRCSTVSASEDLTNVFSSAAYNLNPGISSCRSGPVRFLQPCAQATATCLFHIAKIVPFDGQGIVYKFESVSYGYTYNLKIKSGSDVLLDSVFLLTREENVFNVTFQGVPVLFTLNLNGQFSGNPSFNALGPHFYDLASRKLYAVFTSPVGSPIAGSIGDIQGPTADSVANGEHGINDFLFDPAIISSSVVGLDVLSNFQPSGYSRLAQTGTEYPRNVLGDIWTQSPGRPLLRSQLSDPPSVSLQLLIDKPIVVSATLDIICPLIERVSLSGCLNCGATPQTATFFAKSTCSPGGAFVSTTSTTSLVLTGSVLLSDQFQEFNVSIRSANISTTMEICIAASNRKSCATGSGTFFIIDNIPDNNNSTAPPSTGGVISDSFSPDFLTKVFSGLGSGLEIFVTVLVFLAGLIALILLCVIGKCVASSVSGASSAASSVVDALVSKVKKA